MILNDAMIRSVFESIFLNGCDRKIYIKNKNEDYSKNVFILFNLEILLLTGKIGFTCSTCFN